MDLHGQHHAQREAGYAMAALLIAIAVMHILMSAAMPVWRHATRRELEAELVFRGEQYARAIGLYQRKFAATFPPNLDALIDQRFLRRKYKDPLTEDGEFQILYQGSQAQFGAGSATTARPGQPTTPVSGAGQQPPAPAQQLQSAAEKLRTAQAGAIIGVVSKSKETSIALYNGRNKYNEWVFIYVPAQTQPGMPGGAPGQPGMPGQPGAPGQRGGQGQPGRGPGSGSSPFQLLPQPGQRPGQPPPPGQPRQPGQPQRQLQRGQPVPPGTPGTVFTPIPGTPGQPAPTQPRPRR